jgi:hypothetical protein
MEIEPLDDNSICIMCGNPDVKVSHRNLSYVWQSSKNVSQRAIDKETYLFSCAQCNHIFWVERHINWNTGRYTRRYIVHYQDWEDYIDMEIPTGSYAPMLLYNVDDAWITHLMYLKETQNVK